MRRAGCIAWVVCLTAWASPARAQGAAPACSVAGTIAAAGTPLPGVVVSLAAADGQAVDVSSSAPDGTYRLGAPAPGRYILKGQLVAFAPIVREVTLEATACRGRLDLVMTLAPRAVAAAPRATPSPAAPSAPAAAGARGPAPAAGGRAQARATGNRQQSFQNLSLLADHLGVQRPDDGAQADAGGAAAQLLLPPGFSADTAAESVTALGNAQASSPFGFGGRFGADGFGEGGPGGAPGRGPGGPGGAGQAGGFGRGPFGGPGPIAMRLRNNQIRGSLFQSFDTSGLDAAPYSLNGQPSTKAQYFQQRFGATLGGPLNIPKVFAGGDRTFFFLNYTGNHSHNPYDAYSTVPTAAERAGDLSAIGRAVIDPATGQAFAGNQIPGAQLNAAAQRLLNLIPLPNQPGTRQNFHEVTTTTSQVDDLNLRVIHNFGETPRRPGGQGGGFGGGFGGRGGGGRFGGGSNVKNLNVGLHYRHSKTSDQNPFPTLGGTSNLSAWDIPAGYTFSKFGVFNTLRFQFNRQRSETQNLFAGGQNVAGDAGLAGVSSDPFDWGAPNLSFSSLSSLRDVTPSLRVDQTVSLSGSEIKIHGRHTLRWGGDYRDIRMDSRVDANARGSFVFTGLYSGVDFADFLLGLPQQSTVQYGAGLERFRSRSWDLFLQDDWRMRDTVTLNAGVRYEYASPFAEADNRLVNLDVAPGFTAAVPVLAGGSGPYSGAVSDTLVRPDRNNFAPRVGLAWRPWPSTVVRTGYGINYSTGVYQSIAQQLASQPPFAVTNTILATAASPVALQSALATAPTSVTSNSYGVDPNYRLGYVQIWNVDVQRELSRTLYLGVGYVGTKGSSLDLMRAPNRAPDGTLRIAGVLPFLWESSGADSIMNSVTVRLRKRLTAGIAAGAAYTLSKSIDDASSIGGGAVVVAENDQNLAAERGLSSFDQRHRFSADFTIEPPFGADKRWATRGLAAAMLGGWVFNGNVQLASGMPYTARVLGAVADVAGGVNGTLRANDNGLPTAFSDPTTLLFFNTAAFSVPAAGTFGNAGRNTIIGPGTGNVTLGLTRNIPLGQTRVLSLQILANNVLNTPQFASIDTVVNSPTFGQVTATRPMRRVQILTRLRF